MDHKDRLGGPGGRVARWLGRSRFHRRRRRCRNSMKPRRDRQLGATCSAIRAAYSCPGSAIPAPVIRRIFDIPTMVRFSVGPSWANLTEARPRGHGKEGQRRFVHDSPLEGGGFEPSVPLPGVAIFVIRRKTRRLVGSREPRGARHGTASPLAAGPPVRIHSPPAESLRTLGPSAQRPEGDVRGIGFQTVRT